MRLAHLILAHDRPLQLERLIKRLIYADTDIYIHLDGKCDMAAYSQVQGLENVFFIANRTTITWANYSMVTATINSFSEILNTGNTYSHINLLSGRDYPLKDAGTIQQFLFDNPDTTFMRYKHVYKDWEETTSRFNLYSFGDYEFPFKYKIQGILNKVLPARKLPNKLEPYGFSQWFTITPVCAKYVIDYLEKHRAVKRFFRMTWGVDELVFQTILLNSPLKDKVVNNHLRYIKFKNKASNPDILTLADKDALIASGKFYARKFDAEVDEKILDYLDEMADAKNLKN